jgi:hypothetical protein
MSAQLEPEDVRGLWKYLQERFGSCIVTKSDAKEMQAIGTLLDALGILDKEKFLNEYCTTIGHAIYVPFQIGVPQPGWDLWQQVMAACHEHQHVVQHVRDGLAYEVGYATDTSARARHEAEAYLSNIELERWRTGQIPTPRRFAEKLAHYGCTEQDILWAAKYLTLSAETIRLGGVVTEAGAIVLDWLDEHVPELAQEA